MRRREAVIGGAAMGAAAFCGGGALARPALTTRYGFNDDQIVWRLFGPGAREAERKRGPIFLVVHATWCLHCLSYRSLFFDPDVVARLQRFTPILVDADAQPEVSERLAPTGDYVPRTLILDAQGAIQRDLHLGYSEFEYFVDYLDGPKDLQRLLAIAEDRFFSG